MANDPKSIALSYIDACGRGELERVAELLSDDLEFSGPSRSLSGARPYLELLRGLGPIWAGSQLKQAFADGSEVCVIYDFVTNTAAGALPIVEWLRVESSKITRITLIFDRLGFQPAMDELQRRTAS